MSSMSSDTIFNNAALKKLDVLDADKYIIALGPDGRQFLGTPNGYIATHLPGQVLREVSGGRVKKIIWASYGSRPGSWFFACELRNGASTFEVGPDTPPALVLFIQQLAESQLLLASLRVQLGDEDSFVVWSRTVWACANVPRALQAKLCEGSSGFREADGMTKGSLRSGTLDNIQWHANGSFYIKSGARHIWYFNTKLASSTWNDLWKEQGRDERMRKINAELAYVAIAPYAQQGETFAFIKKQSAAEDAPFIIHFEQEPLHTNLTGSAEETSSNRSSSAMTSDDEPLPSERPFASESSTGGQLDGTDQRIKRMPLKHEEAVPFRWATSLKTGRPHGQDSWELELRQGDKVKVFRDMGHDWYVAMDRKGSKGWVHGSWLNFGNRMVHANAKDAYKEFREYVEKMLISGQLRAFPLMSSYIDACIRPGCRSLKEDPARLGICVHDLAILLEGAGAPSYDWLKAGRNVWHPDRFARFCRPAHADCLKRLAEQMFVMYGELMEASLEGYRIPRETGGF